MMCLWILAKPEAGLFLTNKTVLLAHNANNHFACIRLGTSFTRHSPKATDRLQFSGLIFILAILAVSRYRVAVMLLIRCTHKVLKLFGEKPRQLSISGAEARLGEWYIHITDEFDGVFFVCMNARSLYALIFDVHGLRTIGDLAGRMLERLFLHMVELGIDQACIRKVAEDYTARLFSPKPPAEVCLVQ